MNNETSVAYMCPECENINLFKINIFSFSGNRKKICKCTCGKSELTFKKNSHKSITVEFKCPICNDNHTLVIPHNQFWSSESFSFPCTYYEATSLIIGKGDKLENAVKEYIEYELEPAINETHTTESLLADKLKIFTANVENNRDKHKFCDCDSTISFAYNENNAYIICDCCGMSERISYSDIFHME